VQLDAMAVLVEPLAAEFVQRVTRPIVDHEKDFPAAISANELPQKLKKSASVKFGSKSIAEACVVECDRTEDVRGLSFSERVYSRLLPDS
jgi:hypothetical protein